MVRSRKFIGIYFVLGVLCAPSCVREIRNVETEYFYGDHGVESVVIGRIEVLEEGVEKTWESPRDPSTKTSFRIFIRGRHSELRVSHYLKGNGHFCLRLPPGEYALERWVYRFPGGYADAIEPLSIYFDVFPGKCVYIGTLSINLPQVSSMPRHSFGAKRTRSRYEIVDEHSTAMGFLKNHYPHFPPSVERHLMRFPR